MWEERINPFGLTMAQETVFISDNLILPLKKQNLLPMILQRNAEAVRLSMVILPYCIEQMPRPVSWKNVWWQMACPMMWSEVPIFIPDVR